MADQRFVDFQEEEEREPPLRRKPPRGGRQVLPTGTSNALFAQTRERLRPIDRTTDAPTRPQRPPRPQQPNVPLVQPQIAPQGYDPPDLLVGAAQGVDLPKAADLAALIKPAGAGTSGLKRVKTALAAYDAAGTDFQQRVDALDQVATELYRARMADEKKASGKPSKSKAAYARRSALLTDLRDRALSLYRPARKLVQAKTMPDGLGRARQLQAIDDTARHLKSSGGVDVGWLTAAIEAELTPYIDRNKVDSYHSTADLEALLGDDYSRLRKLAALPGTPAVLTHTINEVLANHAKVRLNVMSPGATIDPDPNPRTRYRVNTNVMAPGQGGQWERLGALLHEMIHVSVGESYGNTPVFLCFPKDASDQAIAQLAQQRKNQSNALLGLINGDGVLTADQKQNLTAKTDYGAEDKLPSYIDVLGSVGKLTETENANARHWRDVLRGHGSTMVEWDTTSAQMLLWCHFWGIPDDHPVKAALIQMSKDAYRARQAALARNAATLPYPRAGAAFDVRLEIYTSAGALQAGVTGATTIPRNRVIETQRYNLLKSKLPSDDRLIAFDDAAERIDVGYDAQQLRELYPDFKDELMKFFDTEFPDAPQINNRNATPAQKIEWKFATGRANVRQTEQEEALAKDARQRIAGFDLSVYATKYADLSSIETALGAKQGVGPQLDALLGDRRQGFIISEAHGEPDAWDFLVKNMSTLKAKGVTTLYLEGLRHGHYQALLDEYYDGASPSMPTRLATFAAEYDKAHKLTAPASLAGTLRAAKAVPGMRVVGADDASARWGKDVTAAGRAARMNVFAERIIRSDTKRTGKYVIVIGSKHTHTHAPHIKGGQAVPGVAQLMDVLAVGVKNGALTLHRDGDDD